MPEPIRRRCPRRARTALVVAALITAGCGDDDAGSDAADDEAGAALAATFSEPTTIDNEWFGGEATYRLALGSDEDEPLRIEEFSTGRTRTIRWEGGTTEVDVGHFLETSDGELLELAFDYFAQDDDGNVWYFGEDVWNYEDGEVTDDEGTWLAGRDGPPGLILPARPTVGQVFHPENLEAAGIWEEVEVERIDDRYELASGRTIEGVLLLHETGIDGGEERKQWAPGYGNVSVRADAETVDLVYALPNDALGGPVPAPVADALATVARPAARIDADAAAAAIGAVLALDDPIPGVLLDLLAAQADDLEAAADDERGATGRALEQTLIDIARLYEPDQDRAVLDLLARRIVDADAGGLDDAEALADARNAAGIVRGLGQRAGHQWPAAITAAADAVVERGSDGDDLAALVDAAETLREALTAP